MLNQASVPAAVVFADVVPPVIVMVFPVREYVRPEYVSMFPAGAPPFTGEVGNVTVDGYTLKVALVNKRDCENKVVASPVFEKAFNDIVINLTPILFYYLS